MGNVLSFLPVLALLFYMAVIYTSEPMLFFVFVTTVLLGCSFCSLFLMRFFLLGKLVVPVSTADVDRPLSVQIQIKNRGIIPIFQAKLLLEVRNVSERRKSVQWESISHILPGENRVEFFLTLEQAGSYEIRLRKIRIFDLLGLCYLTKRFTSEKQVQVMPRLCLVPMVLSHSVQNFLGDAEYYDEKKSGPDQSEVFQIRPYVPGDKLQSIYWKLSVNTEDFMVKEGGLPKACAVVIFLDYHMSKKRKGRGSFGAFLEIGASLSFSLLDLGCVHYVAWYEESEQEMIRFRIEDEESFYFCFTYYLQEQGRTYSGDMRELYEEQYPWERYLHSLRLTGQMVLYQDEEEICRFSADSYQTQLGGIEVVL